MTVSSYVFQTPYSQPFQVGRPDPVMVRQQSEEVQKEGEKIESNTQTFSEQKRVFDETMTQVKSSTLYAASEGFGMSADQVDKLSSVSKNVKRSEYVKVYVQNG